MEKKAQLKPVRMGLRVDFKLARVLRRRRKQVVDGKEEHEVAKASLEDVRTRWAVTQRGRGSKGILRLTGE